MCGHSEYGMAARDERFDETRLLALLGLLLCCPLAGSSLGVITNAINGAVSPGYFVRIMGWSPGPGIWAASVAQGIFEGAIFGLIFGILFTVVVAIASAARISFRFGFRFVAASVVGSLICWCLGGLLGLLMAWLSPDFFVAHFYRVPTETAERLR